MLTGRMRSAKCLFETSVLTYQPLIWIFAFICRKRPTLEEMQAHRWLNPADYMLKKRERAHFTTNRIQVGWTLWRHYLVPANDVMNTGIATKYIWNFNTLFCIKSVNLNQILNHSESNRLKYYSQTIIYSIKTIVQYLTAVLSMYNTYITVYYQS